jgi:phosphoglycolate phosphatase-like HAD superfamily hydrolase/ADP-ribose pyrophosphatase YjhB (NUDIX family)
MIRNIIFDWSGTLVDDLPAVLRATNFVFAQAGLPTWSLERFRAEFCLPFKKFYDLHMPGVPLDKLEVWFHSEFKKSQDLIQPLPHSREFLQFCRNSGVRTFVLSAVHESHFVGQLKAIGFDQFIDRYYVGVRDKTEVVHRLLEQNNLAPGETLFIGDMQHDIEAARHGGIASCAVLTGYNGLAQLRESNPDLIVEHLGELREILVRNSFSIKPSALAGGAGPIPIVTVGALIFDSSKKVLMVRTHKWSDLWGIPGGKIKWGETSEDALRREIMEETALEICDIRFVLAQDCIHSKEFYRDAHFVLLNYTAQCAGKTDVKLNDEAREFKWVTVEEALAMAVNQPTRKLLEAVSAK